MKKSELITVLEGVMELLQGTVSANYELVLHDLKRPANSVVKIINGHISGRGINASLLAGPEDDQGFTGLLQQPEPGQSSHLITGYQTTTSAGKVLQSASIIYYDTAGKPDAAFCINVDNEPLELLYRLQTLLTPERSAPEHSQESHHSEVMTKTIEDIIARHKLPGKKLKMSERRKVVADAWEQGIFKLRGGLVILAEATGVSRFTIYNDLDALGIHQ